MRKWCMDCSQMFLHTGRLLLRGKETWILLLAGMCILCVMLTGMDEVKVEKSQVAVGVTDEDGTDYSARVISRLQKLDGYEVITGEREDLKEQLAEGRLSAVCVLREGYQEKILAGEKDDLVLLYETEERTLLLSDVLAGAMIPEICGSKGYLLFREYLLARGDMVTETPEEYAAWAQVYFSDDMFNFAFDVEYLSATGEIGQKPGNEVIYQQAIFAIFALMSGMFAVYACMPYHRLLHGRMAGKMKTLPLVKGAAAIGNGLAVLCLTGGFAVLFLSVFVIRNGRGFTDFSAFLVCTLQYLCVIVCIMLLCARGIPSRQGYQVGMMAVVLLLGAFGVVSIAEGLLIPEGMGTCIPNARYVRQMMELYQN
ncbi:MAG: ABC transporter permease [Lachnospiraceae bacterium]|nr:ABC transporter permease [Lachnospiraceae bacterium]